MTKEIERRAFKIEVREKEGARILAGTPIVYNKRSEDMGFYEYIGIGAARDAIKKSDPRLLYGHNSDVLLPIARKKSGTLRETEDNTGVHIEADPPKKNQFVDALMESIERGDVGEMSFGFTVLDDKWEGLDTDRPKRTITKIGEIFDYSYVAFAAYNDTTVALRTLEAARASAKETIPKSRDSITIISGTEDKNNQFNFTGESRFEDAAAKITELRLLVNPKIPANDIAGPDPTVTKEPDSTKDETLEKINEAIERLGK